MAKKRQASPQAARARRVRADSAISGYARRTAFDTAFSISSANGTKSGALPVGGDRHVRRGDIDPDAELNVLRCLGNGAGESTPVRVNIAFIPRRLHIAGYRRAIDADDNAGIARAGLDPCLDHERK